MASDITITLYLAPWQKRMMKDFMSQEQLKRIQLSKVTQMRLKNPKVWCPVSYKIPPEGIRKGDWVIYLTDEQMNIVRLKMNLRVPMPSINITDKALQNGYISFA
jgi:hypothetical protein